MKYQEFIQDIKQYLSTQVDPSHKVVIQPVIKNNGTQLDGLIIFDPLLNISPTIYLNPYYHRYLNGVSMEDIYEDILNTYHEHLPQTDFDISLFKDFEKAKENILIKLVNFEKNKEILEDVPYVKFYDLAIIFVVAVSDFMHEYATILIHNQHLSFWNINEDELYQIAMKNTPNLLPYRLEPMDKLLESFDDSLPLLFDTKMYVLTNSIKIHGASCLTYPALLQTLAKELNDDLLIIPSSIHELLILPLTDASKEYSLLDYHEMIQEVNETQLTDDEVLTDHVYLYLQSTDKLIF